MRTNLAVIALAFLVAPVHAMQAPASPPDDPIVSFFTGWHVIYAHLQPALGTGDSVSPGGAIGTIEEPPAQQSAQYQGLLTIARQLYAQGQFTDALDVLEPAVAGEPDNPFILNEYARGLFQVDSLRSGSRQYYEQLDVVLTRLQNPGSRDIVLDMWFAEAYWKLGLLYLDAKDYPRAYLQFARVALSNLGEPELREQMYGYLAEAAFSLKQQPSADWFIRKTLELNPDNQYVLKFRTSK
ncbi:MAG: hypothetical protein EXR93_11735 [Gemmatimonadetes bacterium]|nr:hypothetical protein [Gemmatimonadota bacterium]